MMDENTSLDDLMAEAGRLRDAGHGVSSAIRERSSSH